MKGPEVFLHVWDVILGIIDSRKMKKDESVRNIIRILELYRTNKSIYEESRRFWNKNLHRLRETGWDKMGGSDRLGGQQRPEWGSEEGEPQTQGMDRSQAERGTGAPNTRKEAKEEIRKGKEKKEVGKRGEEEKSTKDKKIRDEEEERG